VSALHVRSNVRFKGIARSVECAIKAVYNASKVDTLQGLTYHQAYFPAESFLLI